MPNESLEEEGRRTIAQGCLFWVVVLLVASLFDRGCPLEGIFAKPKAKTHAHHSMPPESRKL
jgi:hypothetical protein